MSSPSDPAASPAAPDAIISIRNLSKIYANGFQALHGVDLDIRRGEILALLGPNGAGKTTLIGVCCGIIQPNPGSTVRIDGHDVVRDYRAARRLIGLVPQELTTESFESVEATVAFSRGLFGLPANAARIEQILRALTLWEKRANRIMTLSGGMKRRVLIAKALAHEPRVLFLDEPTAGVDVELRQDMWRLVGQLRDEGVTVILTTHYIEEAEALADRIGVISGGRLLLVEDKSTLMQRLGQRQLVLELETALETLPAALDVTTGDAPAFELQAGGRRLVCTLPAPGTPHRAGADIPSLLQRVAAAGITLRDLSTTQSSLEDIFVDILRKPA